MRERLGDARTIAAYPTTVYLASGRRGSPYPFPHEQVADADRLVPEIDEKRHSRARGRVEFRGVQGIRRKSNPSVASLRMTTPSSIS